MYKSAIFLICLTFCLSENIMHSQGLENIIVEKYYQTNTDDEANALDNGSVTALVPGSIVYRIYVDMAANYKLSSVYGNSNHPLIVNTTTNFYNDPNYGVSVNPGTISLANIKKHTAMIDSWFTAGGVCVGKVGVMETEDNDGTLGNNQGVLANNPGGCFGLPLTGTNGQDGLVPLQPNSFVVPNLLGIGNALDPIEQTAGNNITINNGAIAALGGVVGPTFQNRVLIGQFTTNGAFNFQLNVQLVNSLTNVAENYVASNPQMGEFTHPNLIYNPNTPPTGSITFPTNNATLSIGQSYNLSVSATDNVQVNSVEYFIDNVSFGISTSAPFQLPYVAASGSHTIYAIVTDNECSSTTTSTINFSVTNNIAPTVQLFAPTIAAAGESITLSANASDGDGTISQVEFFINGVSVGVDISSPFSINYIATNGLNQTMQAIATDNVSGVGYSNIILLNVSSNLPPTISINAPENNIEGSDFTVTASAFDSDGTITSVTFFLNDAELYVDDTAPYSYTFQPELGLNQTIFAIAEDNLGATTTSATISFDVSANMPPSISFVSPINGDLFIAPATVSITAEGMDSDGNIAQVDFYINNQFYLSVFAIPYTIDWISSPGEFSISVVATDNLGATSVTQTIQIEVADPNALPYVITPLTQACNEDIFCVTLEVTPASPVDNVIGYDISLLYDSGLLLPTGNITILDDLAMPSSVEVAVNIDTPGIVNISIYLNGTPGGSEEFNGYGDLFCLEFIRQNAFESIDTTSISIPFLQESYILGTEEKNVESGLIISAFPTNYSGQLVHWLNNDPLRYDQDNPEAFVPTEIIGFSNGGPVNESNPALPDLNGEFNHDLSNGLQLHFQRDIDDSQSVQMVINAADAVIVKTLLNTGNFTPSIYQIIAMDVNLDGVVSAGDITQLKQRATLAIGEFQQAWNYDNNGVSNGQPSKDWIFVDATRINQDPSYSISGSFPDSDGTGFSISSVPQVPDTIQTLVTGYFPDSGVCPTIGSETYYAILLGDVNGSFANYEADGIIKSGEDDFIQLHSEKIEQSGDLITIPIGFYSSGLVSSIDFALPSIVGYDFVSVTPVQTMEANSYVSANDGNIRFSGLQQHGLTNGIFAELVLRSNENNRELYFQKTLSMLNGETVALKQKAQSNPAQQWSVAPNPSSGEFKLYSSINGDIQVTSVNGAVVLTNMKVQESAPVQINLNHLNPGVYIIRFNDGSQFTYKKIVISE
jgi:hypothetical protein